MKNLTDNTTDITAVELAENVADDAATASVQAGGGRRNGKCAVAVFAFLVAVAAWVVLMYNGIAALGIGVAGVVLAIIGEGANRRAMRNFATTGLIASGVLLVVVVAFLMVVHWGLESI